jgi:putative phosphoribosyl transferase
MKDVFRDRTEAGQLLAGTLSHYKNHPDLLVLALPRGGVPVAFEVARALRAPLDVFVVRKLGMPGQSELAIGAIASGGVRVLNQNVVQLANLSATVINAIAAKEHEELRRREAAYRGTHDPPDAAGKTIILVDDGVATGSTMEAAIRALRQLQPARIIVAVPTAAPSSYADLQREADEVVALSTPQNFYGVGQWYEDFSQTTDQEVMQLLESARGALPPTDLRL